MSKDNLLQIYDELSAAIDLAEAVGFIADGVSRTHEEAGAAVAVVTTILLDRLKKATSDLDALRNEARA